jgi:hypothetical protein
MTFAQRRAAEQVWLRQTNARQRMQVMKYLRKGLLHPDPALATAAYRWAKGETQFNIFRNTKAGPWVVLATCWVPGLSQSVFKLRVARRIVAVSELPEPSSQPGG